MKGFEFDGEKYARASRHQKEWGGRLLAQLKLQGAEHILDLGCGDGALTEQLAVLAPAGQVLGIDASEGMLQKAQTHRLPNLQFLQMDIDELNFKQQFEIIYSNAALHWVHNHKLLLANCHRALKKGGHLCWNFAAAGTTLNFQAVTQVLIKSAKYAAYFSDFVWPWYMPAQEEYEELMRQSDFRQFQVVAEKADRFFADAAEMIKWLDQPCLVPFLQHINNADVQKAFRSDVIEGMLQRTLQADGRCFESFRRLNIQAQK